MKFAKRMKPGAREGSGHWDVYSAQLPFWVYLVLFLAWGLLVWRLWKRMEK